MACPVSGSPAAGQGKIVRSLSQKRQRWLILAILHFALLCSSRPQTPVAIGGMEGEEKPIIQLELGLCSIGPIPLLSQLRVTFISHL